MSKKEEEADRIKSPIISLKSMFQRSGIISLRNHIRIFILVIVVILILLFGVQVSQSS